jgi:hypothetical protein
MQASMRAGWRRRYGKYGAADRLACERERNAQVV